MGVIILPNGVGGSAGSVLSTATPIYLNSGATTNVWFVDDSGADAVSPAGLNRADPLATFAQAHTNAASGDFVVFLNGHVETVTSAVAWSKDLTLIGEGSISGVPTVTFKNDSAAASMWNITATNAEMFNLKFAAQVQACSAVKVDFNGGTTAVMDGCYFEASGNDDAACLDLDCSYVDLRDTTFISTGISASAQPAAALTATGTLSLLKMSGLVLSNGAYGYATTFAADLTGGTITRLTSVSQSLLLGASIKVLEATPGYIHPPTVTGGGRIDWADVT